MYYLPRIVVLLMLLVFSNCTTTTKKPVTTEAVIERITSEEMVKLMEDQKIQVIDVRTPEEFETGYIGAAENIDFRNKNFMDSIATLDKSKPVIVYCERGGRSSKCSQIMKEAGFTKIYDLNGGISQWKFDGREVAVD
ncbi:rhodanese-like domain-containing protein [Aquimarina intermedia]|uniref:Rhodanese-related sulfurtransferase n=1 Tax=Aquimarina intermedia TaxID=350814 RepID=A0A5S5C6R0_9FLAO|nr:rhodanese-like domain-containing protein [Aquimarina intermedia]TYP73653.1 rhodanese-related sulfurtransferase [Aquimarina intermedia]